VTATASALLTDVRTGYVHGVAEATATASGLTNFWSSSGTVDKKRLEAEREAFQLLVKEAGKTWAGIARMHGGTVAMGAVRPDVVTANQ